MTQHNTKKTTQALLTAAVAVTIVGAGFAPDAQARSKKFEKCYGVVKAGMNDCASSNGTHSCAGMAKADDSPHEWIKLKKGVCEKIAGGFTRPHGNKHKHKH